MPNVQRLHPAAADEGLFCFPKASLSQKASGWTRYAAEVPSVDFEVARRLIEALIGCPDGAILEGISEGVRTDGFLATAYAPSNQFLAARWLQGGIYQEVFWVKPASSAARLGYCVLGSETADVPAPLSRWLDARHHQVTETPSFTSLSALLASQGTAVREVNLRERQLEAECDYLRQLVAEQADLVRQAQSQLREARQLSLADSREPVAAQTPADAWNPAELTEWCLEHDDQIVVLPRARNSAKKSRYVEPALMGVALDLLAGAYRDFRRGLLSKEAFDAAMMPTGLRLAGSVVPSVAGGQGDAYFVTWAGRRRMLDFHLLKGGGRDERYCFRLYFFWDEESQRAVVGSMPAHLSNSLS